MVESLRGHGLDAEQHSLLEEAVSVPVEEGLPLSPKECKVVAKKEAAEAVMMGANLYAPGVHNCRGLRRGNPVSVVDKYEQAVGEGVAVQGEREILERRRGLAVDVTNSRFRTAKFLEMAEYLDGAFYPQSLPSMLACRILDPKPGETVLDVCASPGGKTGAMAQMMKNAGKIISVDRNAKKVERLRANLRRLGVANVTCLIHDARYLARDGVVSGVDCAMVDPPCTAIGLRPKLYQRLSGSDLANLSSLQLQILCEAVRCVKTGGRIAYTTCTLSKEENEEVVLSAARYSNGVRIAEVHSPLGEKVDLGEGSAIRFNPLRQKDSPGYFIALLSKK
ncbi:MAG: RsmB/NOP family class I SAM-dependent RNA methyltransferase [Candidatus Brockarchaeota archaeon]|nr:RsmB/NOP family class I SAM-dependent RNA methyltransferase [Candidatus Brockarchaeota archaeon]